LTDEPEYRAEAERSRTAATAFVGKLRAGALADYLLALKRAAPEASDVAAKLARLDPQQRARLLEQVRARKGLR